MSSQAERRRRALMNWLVVHSISASALSLAAGMSRAFLSSHSNDYSSDMKVSSWEALAAGASKLTGRTVTVGELQGDFDQPQHIEIAFKAGAGAEIFKVDGDGGFGDTVAPPGFVGTACMVVGDSGVPMFEPGDVLFIAPAEKPSERILGKVMVVKIKDGPEMVKRVMRGSRKGRYDLQSINPGSPSLPDRALDEVAHIRWVRRAG
jgi:phage repressor protein C with HTH and peptisase S24 domain